MISSTANSRVKHVVQLREKGRERKKEGRSEEHTSELQSPR